MKVVAAFLIGLITLAFGYASAYAQEAEWNFRKEKQGIKVYTRKVAGSPYRAVMGETIINHPIATLVTVIQDAKACPEWADLCKSSSVVEQLSPTEAHVYTHNDLPWPVKDRDVVAHVVWGIDDQGVVTMDSKATGGILDKNKGIVRIEKAQAKWVFTPLSDTQVKVVFEAHMDPNGPLPGWLLNRLIANSPIATLTSFAEQAAKEKYRDVTMPF